MPATKKTVSGNKLVSASRPAPARRAAPVQRVALAGRSARSAPVAVGAMPKAQMVGLKVNLILNAKNGLRRISFGLEKKVAGGKVTWIIHFELFERASKSEVYVDPLVKLDVEIESKLNKQAETAASKGLTVNQAAHALGPGAEDAKAAKAGEIPEAEAAATVRDTLAQK